jgi:hypothetical protein
MAFSPPAIVGIVVQIGNALNTSIVQADADGDSGDAELDITPGASGTITEAFVVTEQGVGGPTGTFDTPFTDGTSVGVAFGGDVVRIEDGYLITCATAEQNPEDIMASQEWGMIAYNTN